MGRSQLEQRLTRQLVGKKVPDAAGVAHGLLVKRGQIQPDGDLTAEGKRRQALGNGGRAKDRAAKASKHAPTDFSYNPKTNGTRLKK